MPFLTHFNLKQRPFSLTPNSGLYFPSETHQQVLASLVYAIDRGEGILKVSGEVGTGKTLLCRMLCRLLTSERTDRASVAYIINPQDDANWVVGAICREFGLDPDATSDPFHALNLFLLDEHRKGRHAVVVVDEAQALGPVGLETVRRLSNLETDKSKLLQIVLFGQPELDRLLQSHELRQLNQRIAFSFALGPLSEETTIEYIRYRVERTSANGGDARRVFDDRALRAIARSSRGIPRVTNIIADKSMIAAFSRGATRVTRGHVHEAIADSREIVGVRPGRRPGGWSRFARMVALTNGAVVALGAAGWWAVAGAGADGPVLAALAELLGLAAR